MRGAYCGATPWKVRSCFGVIPGAWSPRSDGRTLGVFYGRTVTVPTGSTVDAIDRDAGPRNHALRLRRSCPSNPVATIRRRIATGSTVAVATGAAHENIHATRVPDQPRTLPRSHVTRCGCDASSRVLPNAATHNVNARSPGHDRCTRQRFRARRLAGSAGRVVDGSAWAVDYLPMRKVIMWLKIEVNTIDRLYGTRL